MKSYVVLSLLHRRAIFCIKLTMPPCKAWSIFQLQHALRLQVMTNQVEHQVNVKMGKSYKAT